MGARTSEAKAEASRENGKLGGYPKGRPRGGRFMVVRNSECLARNFETREKANEWIAAKKGRDGLVVREPAGIPRTDAKPVWDADAGKWGWVTVERPGRTP